MAFSGNISLTIAVRRGRIDADFRRGSFADLALLDITTDQYRDFHAWDETLSLADRARLILYEAAHLELAGRRSLPPSTVNCAPQRRLLACICSGRTDQKPDFIAAFPPDAFPILQQRLTVARMQPFR